MEELFAFDFFGEVADLLSEGLEEEGEPGLPVGEVGADGALGAAEGEVVGFLALFDHALEGAVGDIGVARAEEEQGGEDAAEAAIAILEGVDLEEDNREESGDEEGMEGLGFEGLGGEGDELSHEAGGGEGGGGLEGDADFAAVLIEGGDAIGGGLVLVAMVGVFLAVGEEVAVELLDVVFGEREVGPGLEDQLHPFGVTGDLLLIARFEGFNLEM